MSEICVKPIGDNKAKLVDCSTGKEVDLCEVINRCGHRGAKGTRGKRAPSSYNIFLGSCVKGKSGPITQRFKSCVEEWKRKR